MKIIGPMAVSLAFCAHLSAAVINVSDVSSLKTAVENENNGAGGDTIVLAAGTYTITSPIGSTNGGIAIHTMVPMTLKSLGGPSTVTINCNGFVTGLHIVAGNTVIEGLTITNAQGAIAIGTPSQVLTGIVLRNLVVATSSTTGSNHAISTSYMNNSVIESTIVTYGQIHGINLMNSSQNLILNNTVSQTVNGDAIALVDSDHNTVTGNRFGSAGTTIGFDAVALEGAQYNYIGYNTMMNCHNAVTLTRDPGINRRCIRNWVGNNHMVLHNAGGSDGVWFNDNSNYNMSFGNDATASSEQGLALFNSIGNFLEANVFFGNPGGGIFVNGDPSGDPGCAPNCATPSYNYIQQNYLYNYSTNGGVITRYSTNDDVSFNFIAGTSQIGLAGLTIQSGSAARLYSNTIQNLNRGESLDAATTSAVLYTNRHLNAPQHFGPNSAGIQWDSGSTVLGGSFYSDFNSANGNPSNGSTPYTNISSGTDHYPYQSESLGKNYGVTVQLPAAGTSLAAGTFKTISWISQGCVFVDLTLYNSSNSATAIVSNYPDFGFYRWTVPAVAAGAYSVKVTCKNSALNATSASASSQVFNITTSDLTLLSPQHNLMVDSGAAIQVSWSKSSNVTGGVDVYIRYNDSQAYSLLQGGITADFAALTLSSPAPSNRVNVKIVSGSFADSTDGWFSIRSTSTGQFTSPATAGGTLYVGTPYPVEWISPTGTDYVNIDLLGGATKNLATSLADFGRFLVLVPDVQGASMTFRLTFFNAAGTNLGTAVSPASTITAGTGFSACTNVSTTKVTDVQALIRQALGLSQATSDMNADGKVNVVDIQRLLSTLVGC